MKGHNWNWFRMLFVLKMRRVRKRYTSTFRQDAALLIMRGLISNEVIRSDLDRVRNYIEGSATSAVNSIITNVKLKYEQCLRKQKFKSPKALPLDENSSRILDEDKSLISPNLQHVRLVNFSSFFTIAMLVIPRKYFFKLISSNVIAMNAEKC